MSDEMNTNNGEETAALFVSSQKKKQAEEEAAQKAAEEKAKRDAAEAEVRRMEAEVEERKRKAEEERRALEEAAKQAEADKANIAEKLKASVNVDEIRSKVREKAEGKSKLPIFIGAGVAAVVIIVLILVFALKGKGQKIDFETLEFAKEYTVSDEECGITVVYPESLYTGLAETKDGEIGIVSLKGEKDSSKLPDMDISISPFGNGEQVGGIVPAKSLQAGMEELVDGALSELKIQEKKISDIEDEKPGKYFYDCTGSFDTGDVAAVSSWIENDSNNKPYIIMACFRQKGDDPTDVTRLRDMFEEANSDNAIKIPGGNPPASADTDGMLEIDDMHMGVIVPKDWFGKTDIESEGSRSWIDDNGAIYAILYREVDFDFDTAHEHAEEVQTSYLLPLYEAAAGLAGLPDLESRMQLEENWVSDLKHHAEYKNIIGGVTYWEGNWASMWRDVRTNKYYVYDLVLMAPYANEDIYKGLFDKATDRLQDI